MKIRVLRRTLALEGAHPSGKGDVAHQQRVDQQVLPHERTTEENGKNERNDRSNHEGHEPLQATPLGLQTAPELTTVLSRLEQAAVRTTIVDGRPERGMQSWKDLPAETIDDLVAFLKWLNEDRAELGKTVGGVGSAQPLPWWEYK